MTIGSKDIHERDIYERNIKSKRRMFPGMGMGRVVLRYDDTCENGHNTFSITVDGGNSFGGCNHEGISKVFPEYAPLIKWHLFDSDGPMHYIANTIFWAEGGRIKAQAEVDEAVEALRVYKHLNDEALCKDCPDYGKTIQKLEWSIGWSRDKLVGAKGPNIGHARASAVAPDATIEQLQDKGWLEARLPGLIEEFKAAMETLPWKLT